jgi:hypothetical protein
MILLIMVRESPLILMSARAQTELASPNIFSERNTKLLDLVV